MESFFKKIFIICLFILEGEIEENKWVGQRERKIESQGDSVPSVEPNMEFDLGTPGS